MSGLPQTETWVRFGPNGIGLSEHNNRYSAGVNIGNWVENKIGTTLQTNARLALQSETTHSSSYVQPDISGGTSATFQPLSEVPRPLLLNRSIGMNKPTADFSTTYELAHCHAAGPRKVQDTMWSMDTKKNMELPETAAQSSSLLEKKKAEWAKQKESVYASTYQKNFQDNGPVEMDSRGRIQSREFLKSTDSISHKLKLRADE